MFNGGLYYSAEFLQRTFPRDFDLDFEEGRAFFLIDMQPDYTQNINSDKLRKLIISQKLVLDYCRRYDLPTAVIENGDYHGTITELKKEIERIPRSEIFKKKDYSPFKETDLAEKLSQWEISEAFVMGIYTNQCVSTFAQQAQNQGLKILTAEVLTEQPSGFSQEKGVWFKQQGIYIR